MSRICIIRHYYYPEDPRSRREAEALADAGHEVDILTLRHPDEPAREVINGVNVRRLPVEHYRGSLPKYAYEYGAFFFLAFLVLTARLFRRRYDVVQVNSLPDFLVFAAVAYKLAGVPVVIDMHECTPELFCTKYGASQSHPDCTIAGMDRAAKPGLRGPGDYVHAAAACSVCFDGAHRRKRSPWC